MNEKEGFDFQEKPTEEGFPYEEVREVSLVFPEEEEVDTWPPKTTHIAPPATGDLSKKISISNGEERNGKFFYLIVSPSGITLNGNHYPQGGHWFNEEIYSGVKGIDAPFNQKT